jgi:hypothetical protein
MITSAVRGTALSAAAILSLAVFAEVPASADSSTSGSATAKAVYGSAVTIAPTAATGSGLLGATVASLVQPIADTLANAVNSTVATSVRGLLNSTGNTADTSGGETSYPTGPLAKMALPGLLSLDLYTPAGSVTASPTAYSAQSTFSSLALRALNIDAGDVAAASASVTCPATGSPSATVSLADLALINGYVRARMNQGTFQVSADGGLSWAAVRDLHLTTVPGHSDLQIVASGDFLQIKESIGVDRLLGGLGLGGLFSGMPGQIDTKDSNLTLTFTVGPGSYAGTDNSMSAWGLEVGVDVSGTIAVKELSSLGLLGGTATINVPTGISGEHYGNLLDLKLAYAACTTGVYTPASRVPPGLI